MNTEITSILVARAKIYQQFQCSTQDLSCLWRTPHRIFNVSVVPVKSCVAVFMCEVTTAISPPLSQLHQLGRRAADVGEEFFVDVGDRVHVRLVCEHLFASQHPPHCVRCKRQQTVSGAQILQLIEVLTWTGHCRGRQPQPCPGPTDPRCS